MFRSLILTTVLILVCSAAAFAGVPDPTRSGCEIVAPPLCQFRFNASGGLDTMTLLVTLRDAFDVPVAGCTTTAQVGNAGLIAADCAKLRFYRDRLRAISTAGNCRTRHGRCRSRSRCRS